MKATFALLANTEVHNFVRKVAWEVHRKYRTGTNICRLPPHISLKQPFAMADTTALEDYVSELAKTIAPFEVSCTELQLVSSRFEGTEAGILWLAAQESNTKVRPGRRKPTPVEVRAI